MAWRWLRACAARWLAASSVSELNRIMVQAGRRRTINMCSMETVRAMICHSHAACCSSACGGASEGSDRGASVCCHPARCLGWSSLMRKPSFACFGGLAKACLCSECITHRVAHELGRPLAKQLRVRLNAGVECRCTKLTLGPNSHDTKCNGNTENCVG